MYEGPNFKPWLKNKKRFRGPNDPKMGPAEQPVTEKELLQIAGVLQQRLNEDKRVNRQLQEALGKELKNGKIQSSYPNRQNSRKLHNTDTDETLNDDDIKSMINENNIELKHRMRQILDELQTKDHRINNQTDQISSKKREIDLLKLQIEKYRDQEQNEKAQRQEIKELEERYAYLLALPFNEKDINPTEYFADKERLQYLEEQLAQLKAEKSVTETISQEFRQKFRDIQLKFEKTKGENSQLEAELSQYKTSIISLEDLYKLSIEDRETVLGFIKSRQENKNLDSEPAARLAAETQELLNDIQQKLSDANERDAIELALTKQKSTAETLKETVKELQQRLKQEEKQKQDLLMLLKQPDQSIQDSGLSLRQSQGLNQGQARLTMTLATAEIYMNVLSKKLTQQHSRGNMAFYFTLDFYDHNTIFTNIFEGHTSNLDQIIEFLMNNDTYLWQYFQQEGISIELYGSEGSASQLLGSANLPLNELMGRSSLEKTIDLWFDNSSKMERIASLDLILHVEPIIERTYEHQVKGDVGSSQPRELAIEIIKARKLLPSAVTFVYYSFGNADFYTNTKDGSCPIYEYSATHPSDTTNINGQRIAFVVFDDSGSNGGKYQNNIIGTSIVTLSTEALRTQILSYRLPIKSNTGINNGELSLNIYWKDLLDNCNPQALPPMKIIEDQTSLLVE